MSNLLGFPTSWTLLVSRATFLLQVLIFSYFNEYVLTVQPQLPSSFLLSREPGTLGGVATVRDLHVIGGDLQRKGVRIHQ